MKKTTLENLSERLAVAGGSAFVSGMVCGLFGLLRLFGFGLIAGCFLLVGSLAFMVLSDK